LPRGAPEFKLTPINQRRLDNFKANRAAMVVVLDLPRRCSSRCSPSSSPTTGRSRLLQGRDAVSGASSIIPEEKFGGFLAQTDYRDPVHPEGDRGQRLDDLAADPLFLRHRNNLDLCRRRAPSPPPGCPRRAALRRAIRKGEAPADPAAAARLGNTNWLGTDDQGRDVLARLIYGFRISVLFGLR
jgi:microcin C transport system permease protein